MPSMRAGVLVMSGMINYGAVIPVSLSNIFERSAFILNHNGSRYLITNYFTSYSDRYGACFYLDDERVTVSLKPVLDNARENYISVFECPSELDSFPALYSANTDAVFYDSNVNVYYGTHVTYAGHMSYSYFRSTRGKASDHIDVNRVKGVPSPYPMVRSGVISGMDSMENPKLFYMSTGFQLSKYYAGGPVISSNGLVIGVLSDYPASTSLDPYYIDELDEDIFTVVYAIGPILAKLDSL